MKKKLFSEIPYLKGKRLTIRALTADDASSLQTLMDDTPVYRYLPTFLFEKNNGNAENVIKHLYDECWKDSIILGVFENDEFCGLAEMYGFKDPIHKISVGYRYLSSCWGRGIATEALKMVVDYLYNQTDIEIITASTMIENKASANVLRKNGFSMVVHAVGEDWGFGQDTVTDKWIR